MTWPTYSQYRDSGVGWLGHVPIGWPTLQVKNRFSITLGKMLNERATPSDIGELVPYLRAGNVQPEGLNLGEVKLTRLSAAERKSLTLLQGDLVVVEGGAGYGRSAVLQEDLLDWGFQNHIMRVRPTKGDLNGFLDYIIKTLNTNGHISTLSNHATIPSLSSDQLARIRIPMPDIETQQAVVEFLDRETAKIDALIGKQEQLIATLREDRAATIDSAFPMEGELTPLKAVLLFAQTGPFGTQLAAGEYITDGVPVINPTHIQGNKIVPAPGISVSPEKADQLGRHQLKIGDLVLGRKGEVDKAALTDAKSVGFVCGSDAMLLRPRLDVVVPAYLWWFLQSPRAHSQLEQWSVGSTVAGLNQTTMRKIRLPHPPLSEQRQLVDRLEAQTAKIDVLVAKAEDVIQTLREYRSALITDAVTGKIDVRGAA